MKIKSDNMKNKSIVNYFGLFDGLNGELVADELKENLHNCIIDDNFFNKPVNSIFNSFKKFEKCIIDKYNNRSELIDQRSGSCALVSLLIGKEV
jgi:hypothetical protein